MQSSYTAWAVENAASDPAAEALAPGHPAAEADRRRVSRRPHVAEAWICSPTSSLESDRIEVSTVNLSRHGVAFDIDREIPPATFYRIEVTLGEQRVSSEIRILYCRHAEEGLFQVGAEFC